MHQPERHDGQIIIAGLLERADDQLARAAVLLVRGNGARQAILLDRIGEAVGTQQDEIAGTE